ncbi:MAG: DUF4954 family protein [Chitinophagaceae bacterium]|nr:DUF4954 family protein [Chitinophagaceae bacterium]
MNHIAKQSVSSLGYGFIAKEFIPKGKNEYHLRNIQHRTGTRFRKLTAAEITTLEQNANTSDDWSKILVADAFDPKLVKRCSFFGLIRIGKLEPWFHEFNNLRMPVGLYNSTIISCDIGDNVVIDNVNFMSHYIVGNDVMLVNINELATTDHAKFGNGVLKDGEKEAVRIWMEICNENGGRSILPFNGMQTGDAWLWSKYRDDEKLLEKFKEFTDKKFDTRRGYYGKIGDRTVIKNCRIIKDTWIGSDAYLKGANKLKNLTINSSPDAKSQIGEGCELVNGIVGFGCRIFYGVKAVRFLMGNNSQLKYGARLINSYLGDNSTISCCEVLNSLIFPAHEQHHNNSFLCAATLHGQSNLAAGATIGSNHNSRGADGELIAGRGFWPGLCVSLKHNSQFATFNIIAKGDFPAELNIPLPFSLISNDTAGDRLVVMPAYWFQYNLYALARNAGKYNSRDKRVDKTVDIEYDYLAPDSVNEMLNAMQLLQQFTAAAWHSKQKKAPAVKNPVKAGRDLLTNNAGAVNKLEVLAEGFENSRRKVVIVKSAEAWQTYKEMIMYYGVTQLAGMIEEKKISSWQQLIRQLPSKPVRKNWKNIGGLLITEEAVTTLKKAIKSGKINGWDEVHEFYRLQSKKYQTEKRNHAWAALLEVLQLTPAKFTRRLFSDLLQQAIETSDKITQGIYGSRAKDYENSFRQMVYDTEAEMNKVIGKLSDNSFISQQKEENRIFAERVAAIRSKVC